ncbi:ABC transporter permease [Kitasatospora viridis]|uniref:Simple sugar transport system permease protein n=1 Tax=Kitasatospora viridis TaxID=281105 RepID=A0A561UJQ2_9ACTN|nr:ABC transporter permease [Kitasatospora viridis]TWF99594.1 simple sugar transport system permease protein [Kitasatospora viridis]
MTTSTESSPGLRPGGAPRRGRLQRIDRERLVLAIAAPVLAVLVSVAICCVLLAAAGYNPFDAFRVMSNYGFASNGQVAILNKATTYYIAGIAVAFGFRMNLFNIGANGQYQLGALFAAYVGGAVNLPSFIEIPLVLVTAMLVGGFWAGIAGVLKVTRGVNEVISTIMLNAITTGVIGVLLVPGRFAPEIKTGSSNSIQTKTMAASSDFFTFNTNGGKLYGFIIIAVLLGVLFQLTLSRTRFGFDLRATGRSEEAAGASGVNVKRMVLISMCVSGALAGLIGMPDLLSADTGHFFGQSVQAGVGFTGIAIALLGRNTPIGIAFATLLWAFLDATAGQLSTSNYPPEIVNVMQGTIVICVVVAYELVRRFGIKRQQQKVGAQLAAQAAAAAKKEVAA